MPTDFSQFGPILMAVLVIFVIYRRLRRTFGRQTLSPTRMSIRIALFALIGCTLLPQALRSTAFLGAEFTGLVVGVVLAIWGAQRTRFLMYAGRLNYVPHTYTGIAVSLLFLGRLVYRFFQFYTGPHASAAASAADPGHGFTAASMVRSPLTLGLLFVLIGYYVCYYSLVLWKSKQIKPEDIEVATVAA